jgi:hypothetical protein
MRDAARMYAVAHQHSSSGSQAIMYILHLLLSFHGASVWCTSTLKKKDTLNQVRPCQLPTTSQIYPS